MEVPVPTTVPPQLPEYQVHVVASFRVPLKESVLLEPGQIVPPPERVGTVGLTHGGGDTLKLPVD